MGLLSGADRLEGAPMMTVSLLARSSGGTGHTGDDDVALSSFHSGAFICVVDGLWASLSPADIDFERYGSTIF